MVDISPSHPAHDFATCSRRVSTHLHPNRRKLRGATVARRPSSDRGLHHSSLLQHVPNADGLGIVEYLLDGFALLIPRAAVRLFSAGAARRTISNHHRQGLPAAAHRSRSMEIFDLRLELAAGLFHHRFTVSDDALRLAAAAFSAADR